MAKAIFDFVFIIKNIKSLILFLYYFFLDIKIFLLDFDWRNTLFLSKYYQSKLC